MAANAMDSMLISLDAAWLCAAQRDVEREEEERMRADTRVKMQSIRGKYELDASAQLDADLKTQQLELRKRAAKRRQQPPGPTTHLPLLDPNDYTSARRAHPHSPQEQQSNNAKKHKERLSVYELENQRLAVLVDHHKSSTTANRMKTVLKKKTKPHIVNDMLALERHYALSACRLQRWWRALSRKRFWKSIFLKVRATTQIQRVIRGFVCRCIVRSWHRNRTDRAIRIQAAMRGFFIRSVLVSWRQWEYVNVVRIQAIVRGHFDRRRAVVCRRNLAATRLQCLWRARRSRRHTDLLWLTARAIELQRMVRGVQTRKRVRRRRMLFNEAATQIQRVFRGTQARLTVESILRDRETQNRVEWMQVLEAEEEWYRQQRDRLQSRLERFQLLEQLCELEEQYFKAHERVNDMEAIYHDMQAQRLRVSPRAIEHGWVEEMERKMKLQRQAITKTKLEVIFELGLKFKKKEDEYAKYIEQIRTVEEKRQRLEIARDEEFLDYWERECKYQHDQREIERQRQIGDTKRKWRIQFYRLNGKRDQRWRGTHWSNRVLEDAKRREVFSLSKTNLLAEIEAKWRNHLQPSRNLPREISDEEEETRQHIHGLEEQVVLAAANAQTQQTMAIFDPVFRDIEARFETVQAMQKQNSKSSESRKAERRASALQTQIREVRKPQAQPINKADSAERQLKLRRAMQASRIPWHLLDELAADQRKLDEEKTVFKVWRTVHPSVFPAKHAEQK